MEFLDKAMALLGSAQGASVSIALVLELILRLIPTQKPLSILHLIGEGSKKIGNLLLGIGNLLDKVLPQKLK
jgi:hypothetical protein